MNVIGMFLLVNFILYRIKTLMHSVVLLSNVDTGQNTINRNIYAKHQTQQPNIWV